MAYTIAANRKSIYMNLLKPYLLMFLIGCALSVGACGQTGDLFLPGEETESKKEKSKT